MMTWLLLLFLTGCLFNLGIGLWVILVHFFRTDVPAAIGHTGRFRVLHCLYLLVVTWGNILEKLGICSMPKFIRFLHDRIPIRKDPDVVVTKLHFGTIPVRLYQPKAPSRRPRCGIIFFHGGGCTFGSLRIYNSLCCHLSRESDSVVMTPGYRMVPDHRYPSPFYDCMAASIHFLRTLETYGVDPSRVIICGDSAGGSCATSVCQSLMTQPDLPKIRAQILIYPYLQGFNFQLPSHQQNRNVPFLSWNTFTSCMFQYFDIHPSWETTIWNGAHVPPEMREKSEERISDRNIPKRFKERGYQPMSPGPFNEIAYLETKQLLWTMNSPLMAENDIIAQLPETLLVTCEFDILRDDALLYKKRLEDQGVPVSWHHIEDGFHGVILSFDIKPFFFPCSLRILSIVIHFIKDL
ncbi:arylacetamide deacetylase-like 4 [Trichosurus vulpecula]|uniref:arylacetamide deacetylase-like 4 n=1 Tax=Trichosurus vulpecula TaxID=9337 RepID=UPI00186AC68B|nr:arylacetamide deacetylase-like 4 [Trichosurus vulpecula]